MEDSAVRPDAKPDSKLGPAHLKIVEIFAPQVSTPPKRPDRLRHYRGDGFGSWPNSHDGTWE